MACGSIHPQTRTSIFPQLLPSMLDTLNPIYSLSLWWKGCAKYFEAHPRWHKKSIWRQKRGGVDRSEARGGTEPSQIAPHANLWSQAGPPSQDIRNYQGPSFLKWGHFKWNPWLPFLISSKRIVHQIWERLGGCKSGTRHILSKSFLCNFGQFLLWLIF